ncbi:MAG: carboxypeptidase-like regulatory domain-containing protein [Planctomycetota bacterium]|nr:carboxypeptidase-like regulatory domain-containing protein [Planctomycetota bacterium]
MSSGSQSASGENRRRKKDKKDKKNWRAKRRASARMSAQSDKEEPTSKKRSKTRRERPDSARRAARRMQSSAEHKAATEEKKSPHDSRSTREDRYGSARGRSSSSARSSRTDSGSAERKRTDSARNQRYGSASHDAIEAPGNLRLMKALLLSCAFLLIVAAGLVLMKEEKNQSKTNGGGKVAKKNKSRNGRSTSGSGNGTQNGGPRGNNPKRRRVELPQFQMLTGRVVNEDGQAIAPANLRGILPQVSFGATKMATVGRPFPTDMEGAFSAKLPYNAKLLEVRARGYATRLVPLDPSQSTSISDLEIVLTNAFQVEGQILAAENGAPIGNAKISAESGSWRGETRSDLDGHFQFDDAPSEPLAILVTSKGRVPQVVDAHPGMTISLLEGRVARGIVQDTNGKRVSGAEVVVFGSDHPGVPYFASTDSNGLFQIKGLDVSEEYMVLARANGLSTTLTEDWQAPERAEVYVTLVATGSILVYGDDLEDLRLLPIVSQPGFDVPEPKDTPQGFLFEGLAPGRYDVERISDPNQIANCNVLIGQQVKVQAPSGVENPVDENPDAPNIEALENGLPIDVSVVDENGRGLSGATVIAESGLPNVTAQRRQTDASGRVQIQRPSNRVLVVAEMAGRMLKQAVEVSERTQDATVVLVSPARIDGQILPKLPGKVTLVDATIGQVIRETKTRKNGSFILEGLIPGKYVLEIECAGFQNLQVDVTLPLPDNKLSVSLIEGGAEHMIPKGPK